MIKKLSFLPILIHVNLIDSMPLQLTLHQTGAIHPHIIFCQNIQKA